ncbi:hypothetical protein Tco_1554582 [Tanacetum coccineum]
MNRVPQTFDDLMKRTRNSLETIQLTREAVATTSTAVRGRAGKRQVHPTDNDRKGDTRYEGFKLPKTTTNAQLRKSNAWGNGYFFFLRLHRQKAPTTNEYVQLRQLNDKLVKEGRWITVEEHQGRKDKQRGADQEGRTRDQG